MTLQQAHIPSPYPSQLASLPISMDPSLHLSPPDCVLPPYPSSFYPSVKEKILKQLPRFPALDMHTPSPMYSVQF